MSKRLASVLGLFLLSLCPANAVERRNDTSPGMLSFIHESSHVTTGAAIGNLSWSDPESKLVLTKAVLEWVSANVDLPSISTLPHILQVKRSRLSALRYGPLLSPAPQVRDTTVEQPRYDVLAVYVDAERTIYLAEDFNGRTPAELSVLVHEMVHHVQNVARLSHDCPQAREKTAYLAQQRWLEQFGQDLASEFQVDPFTVFARSACVF